MKNFSLREIYNNNKTKSENTMILNLLACVPARARAVAWVLENKRKQVRTSM